MHGKESQTWDKNKTKEERDMKIKLALLDSDKNYLDRLSVVFTNKYPDKIEFHSFTDEQMAIDSLKIGKTDVFLANENFKIEMKDVPESCSFAYIAEENGVESIRDEAAIAKYQRADLFYKQILSLYAEKARNVTGYKMNGETQTKILTFVSMEGGAGSSTVAAAFAEYAAERGKKVLYLNIEQLGRTEDFFVGEGQYDLSDVLFTLKSGKGSMALKLESTVRRDASGVCFYSSPKVAWDLMELGEKELQTLLEELCASGGYDYIVLDQDFIFGKKMFRVFKMASQIVFVNDGSEISNAKFQRGYQALKIYEQNSNYAFLRKSYLFYNKFSNKTSKTLEIEDIRNLGGVPRFEHATTKQVMKQLVQLADFQKIMTEEE